MSTTFRTSVGNTATIKFGTVLPSGATASYPTSFASSPQYNPSSNSDNGPSLSAGAIAGIVIAGVAFLLLVAFLIFLFVSRRRRIAKKRKRESRAALLPPPAISASSSSSFGHAAAAGSSTKPQPDMAQVQRQQGTLSAPSAGIPNYAGTGMLAAPVAAAMESSPSQQSKKSKPYLKTGLSFGNSSSGHRRTPSETPFLASPRSIESLRPPSASFDGTNRYSLDNASYMGSSPSSPSRARFDSPVSPSTPTTAMSEHFPQGH